MNCWKNFLCQSITCMRSSWKCLSLNLWAVKLPGACTNFVFLSLKIANHIMTRPAPKLSTSRIYEESKRSFTRCRHKFFHSVSEAYKPDLSLNQIVLQFWKFIFFNLLHHRTLFRLQNGLKTGPKIRPPESNVLLCRSWLQTVCELI